MFVIELSRCWCPAHAVCRCNSYWPCLSVTPLDMRLQIAQSLNPLSLEAGHFVPQHRSTVLRSWIPDCMLSGNNGEIANVG